MKHATDWDLQRTLREQTERAIERARRAADRTEEALRKRKEVPHEPVR